jgi:hypothetical protein
VEIIAKLGCLFLSVVNWKGKDLDNANNAQEKSGEKVIF